MMNNWSLVAVAMFTCLLAPVVAQDTVYIGAGPAGGQTKLSGQILDYNGRELRMVVAGGLEKNFPAEKVLRVETQYAQQQIDAHAAFANRRFENALALYRKALDKEPRRWVRRQIVARIVRCYCALGRPGRAGEEFLLLIRDDPHTQYFDCIPIAWMPRQPSVALEQTAREWLARDEPAAVLLGASHLLGGRARLSALARLRRLAAAPDGRIARLALAQSWRAAVATAGEQQIDAWRRLIEQLPEPLAAGPYFVLGTARARRKQWEQAALAFLRVAILYPQQRGLAAQSLLDAGRSLEKLGRTEEALRLYRELMRNYPEQTRPVAEVQSRAESMMNDE